MAEGDTPLLDAIVQMNEGTLERSGLDPKTHMLVRIAALAAIGAAPASYLVNLGAASDLGVSEEEVQGVLVAIAPVVGGARAAAAGAAIMRALGLAIAIAEEELEEEED
jgi:alkylhydroperoxidase/carboxymuconolactone decarboxylase family protein YurZ